MMKPYSLNKAKEIVRLYNETYHCETVADRLVLSYRDVRDIVRWLARHDPANKHVNNGEKSPKLALPTSHIWLQFLYSHNVSPQTAAACVAWPYARVLTTCGGEREWMKPDNRRCVLKVNKEKAPEEKPAADPTPAEILLRARELRLARKSDPRFHSTQDGGVETQQFAYDGRIGRFDAIS